MDLKADFYASMKRIMHDLKLRTEITKTKNADRPNFLIVGECHRAASKENSKAIIGGLGA